jgi:hypothetical protein
MAPVGPPRPTPYNGPPLEPEQATGSFKATHDWVRDFWKHKAIVAAVFTGGFTLLTTFAGAIVTIQTVRSEVAKIAAAQLAPIEARMERVEHAADMQTTFLMNGGRPPLAPTLLDGGR